MTERNLRVISRLDIKSEHLVKGTQLEGLRKVGVPEDFATRYYQEGIDEIIYLDIVASLYGRNSILPLIENTAENIFVPLTVGGGIRNLESVRKALRAGADKVAINTAAMANPDLITEVAETFGSQCMILSIEAKSRGDGGWEAYHDNGREHSGRDVIEWIREGIDRGAGEILLTSVDREGVQKGMDLDLIEQVCEIAQIPVIASGGIGNLDHFKDVASQTTVDGIALAHSLHYNKLTISDLKHCAKTIPTVEVRP